MRFKTLERLTNAGYTDMEVRLRERNRELVQERAELSALNETHKLYITVLEHALARRLKPYERVRTPDLIVHERPYHEIDDPFEDLDPIQDMRPPSDRE